MQALAAAAGDGSLARSSCGQVGNVEAVVAADPPSAYDRLAPLVTPGALDPPSAHCRLAELFEPRRAPSAVLLEVLRAVDSPLVAAHVGSAAARLPARTP